MHFVVCVVDLELLAGVCFVVMRVLFALISVFCYYGGWWFGIGYGGFGVMIMAMGRFVCLLVLFCYLGLLGALLCGLLWWLTLLLVVV